MTNRRVIFAGHKGHPLAASLDGPESAFPVLLAHGGGQTRRAWRKVAKLLTRHGFRTVAIDLRGHGESAWAENGAYDIHDFARDLLAVASALDSKPAVIGASLGGLAAVLAEGELAPRSFASLTLVDITPQVEPGGVARVVGFMSAHLQEGFASVDEAARAISEYLPHRPSRTASDGLLHYLRKGEDGRFRWHWDPAFIERIMRRNPSGPTGSNPGGSEITAAAARLRLPVHLIRGGSSDLVSIEAVAHFRGLVPHAEYSDIADATHMVVGDQNDSFGEAIVEFLLRTAPGAPLLR
jgi:pimeloyl-ACP methyl ester carboxylesterase